MTQIMLESEPPSHVNFDKETVFIMRWQRAQFLPSTALGRNGQRITASKEHIELSKAAAAEGMVLLKNDDNVLPLKKGARVALFGKASADYVKGGGGSGDVTVEYIRSLIDGFKALSDYAETFEELNNFYKKNVNEQYEAGAAPGMTVEPELDGALVSRARAYTDTAIISICRFSGEGWDRKSSYDEGLNSEDAMVRASQKIFEHGDFYLSEAEKRMVEAVKKSFPRVVVVLNVGGAVDTSWFANDAGIQSVLMAWQGGMEGGLAEAELLCGIVNPSGRLADTFAQRLEDYPSSYNFHESEDYVDYTEDIYVGYRYFETIPGAAEKVVYPFGYGLSYTKFDWQLEAAVQDGANVTVKVSVTNCGEADGKEVMQLYVKAPQGVLGKPERVLAAFAKTRLLKPGESQLLCMCFSIDDIASYDDTGRVAKSAYVLEAGDYELYLGTSVRSARKLGCVCREDKTRIVKQLSAKLAPSSLTKRLRSDGSFEQLETHTPHEKDADDIDFELKTAIDGRSPAWRALEGCPVWGHDDERKKQLSQVADGSVTMDEFLAQMSDEDLSHLVGGQPNTGVANTFGIGNMPEYGIPNFMTADGPAGLRIDKKCGVNTTAWPCATLLACTWDPQTVRMVGEAGAREVKENNISIWLTPAVNIHRTPMCGRNFEYYSEDPFLAGVLASAMVEGIQSQNIAATVKHFALNNKETNRRESNSRVSERAAREIYLKQFEIIVKKAKPWCIMSSYNIVNDYRASENRELLEDILRGEWGYEGVVTTDWWAMSEHYKEIKAGNDVKMPAGMPTNLAKALDQGLLSRQELEVCARRLLGLMLKLS